MYRLITYFLCLLYISTVSKCDFLKSYKSFIDLTHISEVTKINPRVYLAEKHNIFIILLDKYKLVLTSNSDLFPSGRSEWISDNIIVGQKLINNCEYKTGYVDDYEESTAAVTICGDYISGYFKLQSGLYLIESNNGTHHLKRSGGLRSKRSDGKWEFFNLTGDTFNIGQEKVDENVDLHNEVPEELSVLKNDTYTWQMEQNDELGYFVDSAWQLQMIQKKIKKSRTNPKRWLEIAIAIDATVISFHGRKMTEQYILTLMNIVNAVYQDPSLNANIQLVISRLIFYENKTQSVIWQGNAKKSLENVNIWNKGIHSSLADGENHHDVAVWITRADIGGPSGYAPVSGACDPERSCALNRDEGLSSAFIIAHEIAHILGLSHDGDSKSSNDCQDEALQGSVMAPMVSATFNQFLWSSCSRNEFERMASKWSCLINKPNNVNTIKLNSTLDTTFTMDEQCRMEFGDGAFDIVDPCSHLWCGHVKSPLVCKTKKGPPIEGTECGFDQWCTNGYCENVDKNRFNMNPIQYNPQDGEWSKWEPWGPCSRTCGTGVEFRIRKCDNPKPSYGGRECFGPKEEWRICNVKTCPEPIRDVRAQQCKRLSRFLKLKEPRASMTWLPYESELEEMKCKLICSSKETGELYMTGENLIDGTPCSYENRNDICIQGLCQPLGCDHKIFSGKREDACGVCGGDNSECSKISRVYKRKLRRDVNRVGVFPRFAREIKVEANFSIHSTTDPSVAFILKDRKRKSYSITISNAQQIIDGTKFYYTKSWRTHGLSAKGPVLTEIALLVQITSNEIEKGANISYNSQYYVHKNFTTNKYVWIIGGWGPCSKSCGAGKRYKTKACFDDYNKKIVPKKFCLFLSKPPLQSEVCNNFSCHFLWISGSWEPCSATCGSNGIRSRENYCVPYSKLNKTDVDTSVTIEEPWTYMVNPLKCGSKQPVSSTPCHRSPCPSYWKYGEWSQCSNSCGRGITIRSPYCAPIENETLYSCQGITPLQKKSCKGQFNGENINTCRTKKVCKGDLSKYCSLSLLSRYCDLKGFRKMCCKSCSTKHQHLI